MAKRIKSVSELPDWYKHRSYRKRLSKVDWFREIRMRQSVVRLLEMDQADGHSLDDLSDSSRKILLRFLETAPHPSSPIFFISQSNRPVHALTAEEAIYLRSAIRDEDLSQFGKEYDRLLSLWHKACDEDPEGPTPLFGEYEHQLEKFVDELEKHPYAGKLEQPIESVLDGVGNPWLSYGRPLNGSPITIDTQYDDETITSYFKSWLAEKRRAEGERVRRPFVQNDFDDWEYFKIRELFDLETWATVMNVKILDKVIAHALWPNPSDSFSPIDVLRTTARRKVKDVFNFNVVVRLYGQLLLEYGENFLEQ